MVLLVLGISKGYPKGIIKVMEVQVASELISLLFVIQPLN